MSRAVGLSTGTSATNVKLWAACVARRVEGSTQTWEVIMFGSLGLPELLILLAIVVLIFGVNKLPRLGKGLGEGIRNFKESVKSDTKNSPTGSENGPGEEKIEP